MAYTSGKCKETGKNEKRTGKLVEITQERPGEKHIAARVETTVIRVNRVHIYPSVETAFSGPEHKIMVFVVYSNNVLLVLLLHGLCPVLNL